MSQNEQYRVSLIASVPASNPIEAAHLLVTNAGRPGFDKIQVQTPDGHTFVVDFGLLVSMGMIQTQAPTDPQVVQKLKDIAERVNAEEQQA